MKNIYSTVHSVSQWSVLCVCVCVFRREGEGLRIFWDRLREPSFTSRWNPFTMDFPYITFTYHPVRDISDTFTSICDVCQSISRKKKTSQFWIFKSQIWLTLPEVWSHGQWVVRFCLGLCWNICPLQHLWTTSPLHCLVYSEAIACFLLITH